MLNYRLGSIAATIQSIVYGGATGGLFALLQSAGATMVLPSVGTIFAGAATAGAGAGLLRNGEAIATGEILSDSIARSPGPGDAGGGDNNADPPPYSHVNPHEYFLTPQALQAIVKSWHSPPYNPPGTDVAQWLSRQRHFCEEYGVPVKQQAQCAMHHMGDDCREAAYAAGCHDMSWDRFTTWLLKYDGVCVISKVLCLVLT